MIDPTAKLSVSRQAIMLGISRGSVYYTPRPVSDADLKLMHRIDKLHMEFPFAGSRMLRGLLVQEGFKVGRLHVATLMKRMGIEALYRKPNTSKPAPGHKIYPYLLRKLPITRPNQVWAMDITYIPMARGFIYGFMHKLNDANAGFPCSFPQRSPFRSPEINRNSENCSRQIVARIAANCSGWSYAGEIPVVSRS